MKESYLIVQPGKAHAFDSSTSRVRRAASAKPSPPPLKRKLEQAERGGEPPPEGRTVHLRADRALNTRMVRLVARDLDSLLIDCTSELVAAMQVLAPPIDN